MPKYSVNPYDYDGSEFPPIHPCDFVDADGKVLDTRIVYADTETGIVIEQVPDTGPDNICGTKQVMRPKWIKVKADDNGEIRYIEPINPGPEDLEPAGYTQLRLFLAKAPLTLVPYVPRAEERDPESDMEPRPFIR